MISPHTPPGTKVAFIRKPKDNVTKTYLEKYNAGDVVTIAIIYPQSDGVFVADIYEGSMFPFELSLFRRLNLPECLTSLLVQQYHNTGRRSMTDEQQTVWLLWAQHYDKSGETFIQVYDTEAAAQSAKKLVDAGGPMMCIFVTEIPFTRETK